jgi:glycosyltransferase involved in cell wall biosynthesis
MPDIPPRPPIAAKPLSLVLVACNAASAFKEVVADWTVQLEALKRTYEIILVNDGSTDDTPLLADNLAATDGKFRVVHHRMRVGFGAALQSGIAVAKHPLLACCTCDRQYQPAELSRFLELIDKVDLVTGFRLWRPVPRLLRWLGLFWRIVIRVLFGIPLEPLPCWLGDRGQCKRWFARWIYGVRVTDVECVFRLFRRSIFERLVIQSKGAFALVEILAKANFLGCLMTEVGVSYRASPGPKVEESFDPRDTFLGEARRVFHDPTFA